LSGNQKPASFYLFDANIAKDLRYASFSALVILRTRVSLPAPPLVSRSAPSARWRGSGRTSGRYLFLG
jgi:hypothetical protein